MKRGNLFQSPFIVTSGKNFVFDSFVYITPNLPRIKFRKPYPVCFTFENIGTSIFMDDSNSKKITPF
jgi:hypothetical protein